MASNQAIRESAYYRWKEAGEPVGEDLKHWLEAEKDLADGTTVDTHSELSDDQSVDESSLESFPASDPPARGVSKVGSTSKRSR